jgi:hypothetical protein
MSELWFGECRWRSILWKLRYAARGFLARFRSRSIVIGYERFQATWYWVSGAGAFVLSLYVFVLPLLHWASSALLSRTLVLRNH